MRRNSETHFETKALHAGDERGALGDPVAEPIILSTNFHSAHGAFGFSSLDLKGDSPASYTRWGNPTLSALERRWAALEGAESALAFASGMAAIAAVWLYELKPGDRLVVSDVCYAGAAELARSLREKLHVEVEGVDTTDLDLVKAAITPKTKLIHIETPANPITKVTDIAAVAKLAHAVGAKLSVDATSATPVGARPLEFGADYVIHSLTKYAIGHGDALGGIVSSRKDLFNLRTESLIHLGGVLSPFSAWLIMRGIETLPLRMAAHERSARAVAEFLEGHPRVRNAYWPGLASHPEHAVAKRQMKNFSGMLSVVLKDSSDAVARRASEVAEVFSYAVSLGKTKSLIYYIPTETILKTSFVWSPESAKRYRARTGEGVFRISIGLEHPDDLLADLERIFA